MAEQDSGTITVRATCMITGDEEFHDVSPQKLEELMATAGEMVVPGLTLATFIPPPDHGFVRQWTTDETADRPIELPVETERILHDLADEQEDNERHLFDRKDSVYEGIKRATPPSDREKTKYLYWFLLAIAVLIGTLLFAAFAGLLAALLFAASAFFILIAYLIYKRFFEEKCPNVFEINGLENPHRPSFRALYREKPSRTVVFE